MCFNQLSQALISSAHESQSLRNDVSKASPVFSRKIFGFWSGKSLPPALFDFVRGPGPPGRRRHFTWRPLAAEKSSLRFFLFGARQKLSLHATIPSSSSVYWIPFEFLQLASLPAFARFSFALAARYLIPRAVPCDFSSPWVTPNSTNHVS